MSEQAAHDRAILMDWLQQYICMPHKQIGRAGAVCPFVEPSLRTDCLYLDLVYLQGAVSLSAIIDIVQQAAERFKHASWPRNNKLLQTLIVAIPDVPLADIELIDEAHNLCKPGLTEAGIMIGQFHQRCQEPAARNPQFPVSVSPLPMFAFRWMAIHDIMFLHQRPDWFHAYARRYGRRYRSGTPIDPLFQDLFAQAQERFGDY